MEDLSRGEPIGLDKVVWVEEWSFVHLNFVRFYESGGSVFMGRHEAEHTHGERRDIDADLLEGLSSERLVVGFTTPDVPRNTHVETKRKEFLCGHTTRDPELATTVANKPIRRTKIR